MHHLTFITDETHNHRYAQIDLDSIAQLDGEALEDIIDTIIAEARRNDEKISIEELERQLKAEGRL